MNCKAIKSLAASACVAAALCSSPASAQPRGPLTVPVEEFTLPNGLHVILHEDHTVPIVHTNIWYLVGSSNEKVGKTGFAHLFEHLMFEGSGHVAEGQFDKLLEQVGGSNNASTNSDRTNYYDSVPSSALELPLFLESDRMGYLLDSMSPDVVDSQRDVVKNEMRQSYLNKPYGKMWIELFPLLYPQGHPYSWPVIGSMEDLSAADREDVANFFKQYYVPNNASLVVAGDINVPRTKELVTKWFSEIKMGAPIERPTVEPVKLKNVVRKTITDKVSLPARVIAWHTPALYQAGDAELDILASVLGSRKTSRLYKRLVYELQIAQSIDCFQDSSRLSSIFVMSFVPKKGHTLEEIQKVVDEEIARLQKEPPTPEEIELVVNCTESNYYNLMERTHNIADSLNSYHWQAGRADFFEEDLQRYLKVTPEKVQKAASDYLLPDARVELTIVPEEA